MSRALIGHTGFVGGNLLTQASFDATYNSKNIEAIRGRAFDELVCAGAPGVKWKANREPEKDRASIERLMRCLEEVEVTHFVLVSSIDVYPEPRQVDEDTPIDPAAGHPYGRHRLELEAFVRQRFSGSTVRLPGLFGPELRKNVIRDLLHGHEVYKICADGVLQWYPVAELWRDLQVVREHGLPLVNFATEPMSVRDVAREAFGMEFENPEAGNPADYDMRTRHGRLFGGGDWYMRDRAHVMEALRAYVVGEGWSPP